MKQLTIEEEAQIGEMIAERLGIPPIYEAFASELKYTVGGRYVTASGVYHALKEVVQELREKEVL